MRKVTVTPRKKNVKVEVIHIETYASFLASYQSTKERVERA